jgi:hypothetical protein
MNFANGLRSRQEMRGTLSEKWAKPTKFLVFGPGIPGGSRWRETAVLPYLTEVTLGPR